MSLSLLSPHTFSLTWEMIDLFFTTSDVSFARVSFSTMGAQVLMDMHSSPIEHDEIESKHGKKHKSIGSKKPIRVYNSFKQSIVC